MRGNKLVSVIVLTLGAVVLTTATAAEAPPAMDIPAGGVLGPQHIKQITAWLNYWGQQIAEGDAATIVATAKETLRNYRSYTNSDYRYRFAEKASSILGPLLTGGLKKDDKLLRLREVNLAIILSRLPQVTITPALGSMVSHNNPGVRYLGWEGYRGARSRILAQSQEVATKMFAVLGPAAAKEKSAPAIGAICEMMNISSFEAGAGAAIPPATLKDAQSRASKILEANWQRWCGRVMAGEAEMSKAAGKAIDPIKTLSAAQAAGKDSKRKALQMLVDLMYASGLAFDQADGKGPIGKENKVLLRACELATASVSGVQKNYIVVALGDEKVKDRGAAVRSAAWNWITDMKAMGVVEPKAAPSADTSTAKPAPTSP